jgi:hypothetical protein
VLTFWVAYILTRPIGASFADYFGMPKTSGGLGIGHGPVSLVTIVLVVASIWYLSVTHKDQPSPSAVVGMQGNGRRPGTRPEWDGRQGWEPQGQPGWEPRGRPGPEYAQRPGRDPRYPQHPDSPDSPRWPR